MNTRTFIALIIFLCIAGIQLGAQSDNEAESDFSGNIVLPDSIFVRAGPSNEYLPIGALTGGDSVFPVSQNVAGDWIVIPYRRGFGWIRRDLVDWEDDLDALPVVLDANLTITPIPGRETATPFFPTETPVGNYVLVEAESAYVRAGPGQGYVRVGQLFTGDLIEAVGRNESIGWVMIRFDDGFGWVAYNLARWQDELDDLPILTEDDLTPTITLTPSNTPTRTRIPTRTALPTATPTPTALPSATSIVTERAIPTSTLIPTLTFTYTPTATNTATSTASPTKTSALTVVPSNTVQPTTTSTASPTKTSAPTVVPSDTAQPTATFTLTLTALPTSTLTLTHTIEPTDTATETVVPTYTLTATSTATDTLTSTSTPTNTETPTLTSTATSLPTEVIENPTQVALAVVDSPVAPSVEPPTNVAPTATLPHTLVPTVTNTPDQIAVVPVASEGDGSSIPVEALIGGVILLIVLIYVALYWQGLSAIARYQDGFVIDECPVCRRGALSVETRQDRIFGIPRARHTVRCSVCRSTLRETGTRKWRYAVDPIENPVLYERYNGREVMTGEIASLLLQSPQSYGARTLPEFTDDEPDE